MMTTDIKQVASYLDELVQYEVAQGGILGKHTIDIIIHDRSVNINAASIEVKLKVYNNEGNDLLGEAKCSILVVEKVTISPKTHDEFRRTCVIIVNDNNHEIVWNKMSREATKQAAEYCLGYIVNHASIIREKHPVQNIKEYVINRVKDFYARTEEVDDAEDTAEVATEDTEAPVDGE